MFGYLIELSTMSNQLFFSLHALDVDVEPIIPSIDPINIGLGSSEKGNAITAAKPRKKTMTSVYLKFFETAPDGKSRRCKFCGQSYSIATATGNFFSPASLLLLLLLMMIISLVYL